MYHNKNVAFASGGYYYHNIMKNKLIKTSLMSAVLLGVSCSSTSSGWGHNQGRGTIGGGLLGATAGGIIGHQSGKQKEGILIGTVLGGLVGNQVGRGKDKQQAMARSANVDREMEYERARVVALEKQLSRERELHDLRERQSRAQHELNSLQN